MVQVLTHQSKLNICSKCGIEIQLGESTFRKRTTNRTKVFHIKCWLSLLQ